MIRQLRVFLLLALICSGISATCRPAGETDTLSAQKPRLRISIITGGPSEENWGTFGHSCIRVIDSSRNDAERDKVYNYGTFESYPHSTMYQFLTGRVKASMDTITYEELMIEYAATERKLTEYVLVLDPNDEKRIQDYLKRNLEYRYRYYDYNTFFDDCGTRIRDVFESVFGSRLVWGQSMPGGWQMTFRNAIFNRYCPEQYKYWFGFGLNLLYSGDIDKVMNNREAMCLPLYLASAFSGATVDGKSIGGERKVLFDETILWHRKANEPFILSILLAMLTMAGLLLPRLRVLGTGMSVLVPLIVGLLGCGILYTWWLDGEPTWHNNLNLLWALPTNLIIPFLGPRARARYAIGAIGLIIVSLLVHIFKIQSLPLFEISGLLLAAIWAYGNMYRRNAGM